MTAVKKTAAKQDAGAGAIIHNADGSVTISLHKPLDVDGTKVTALRMREPTVGDQEMAEEIGKGKASTTEMTLVANLCMVTIDQVRALSLKDYAKVQAALSGFLD